MHSTLPSKPTDDPCDVVVVEPDAVRVAPSDDELSDLLHQAARYRSDNKTSAGSDTAAGSTAPPVDTTFRPTSINGVAGSGGRSPLARRAARAFITLLLAVCMGLSAVAWKSYGDVAKKKIAKLATQVVLATQMPFEKSEPAAQPAAPAIQTSEANAASPQPPPATQTASEATTTTDDSSARSAQLLQSMATDLATLRQEVEQLKASMEQLKASQQQASRQIADGPQPKARTRMPAPPPRSTAARVHRPVTSYSTSYSPPPIAAAPALPQAAPYYAPPSRPQQQTTVGLPADPELSSVPRPPMPVR
jgi:hypothetical protein